jgi:hypothetical protein
MVTLVVMATLVLVATLVLQVMQVAVAMTAVLGPFRSILQTLLERLDPMIACGLGNFLKIMYTV